MTLSRGKYAGVLSIVQYNARFYVASACLLVVIAILPWLQLLPRVGNALLIAAAIPIAFWTLSSLAASYYVYDRVGVTRWRWLPRQLTFPPRRWVNIHAGLDESTQTLKRLFPNAGYSILDIYDPQEMTEPSIARARRAGNRDRAAAVACQLNSLPLPDKECDTVFLLFAAHEIRQPRRRVEFFRESSRVLSDSGQLVLVEHLRDWKNFAAFGPGFLHFHSRREWLRVAEASGLTVEGEASLTPLVRCFVMHKTAQTVIRRASSDERL